MVPQIKQPPLKYNKFIQTCHLAPVKAHVNPIFSGAWEKNQWLKRFLCRMILYRDGYWVDNRVSPNHLSSQNRLFFQSPKTKEPQSAKSSLTPMRPFQKRESMVWFELARAFIHVGTVRTYYVAAPPTPFVKKVP
jgi:hypothetical protein